MRTVRAGLMALLMLVASFGMLIPPAGAAKVGNCENMGANGAVIAPPGAGLAGLGWAPDCITIDNGSAVTFGQVDAIGHVVLSGSCVLSPSLLTRTFSLTVLAEDGFLYANGVECDPSQLQHRSGSGIGRPTGEALPIVEFTDSTATLYYICKVHGPVMNGKIVVPL